MKYLALAGRILFASIFLISGPGHFSQDTIGYAASHGVPLASVAVPASGILAIVAALSIMVGFQARIGAWLLVLFLVPVTFAMHDFWNVADPMAAMTQRIMFLKNVSLLGGALLIAHFGAGPLSVDERRRP